MPDSMKNIDFYKLFIYVGFGCVNILMWLFLMALAIGIMSSCTTSKPQAQTPTLEELKDKFADKDTLKDAVPVEVEVPADSVKITIIPDLLPIDMPVLQTSKKGGLQVSATRRKDNSLDISALQKPLIIRDTVEREIPVVTFNQCKVEGHVSSEEASKMVMERLQEYQDSTKITSQEIFKYITWYLVLIFLIVLALLLRSVFRR
jgi:hypothetical protein